MLRHAALAYISQLQHRSIHQQASDFNSMRMFLPTITLLASLLPLSVYAFNAPAVPQARGLPYKKRIVVVGDLHADYNNTLEALRLGRVVDTHGNWIGRDTTLVQVGDIFDR
jgi:hypothetical protein